MTVQLSDRQVRAILKAQEVAKKKAQEVEHAAFLAEFTPLAQPMAERIVESVEKTDRSEESSPWAGWNVATIPVEIGGKKCTMTVRITDTERLQEKLAAREALAQELLASLSEEEVAALTAS